MLYSRGLEPPRDCSRQPLNVVPGFPSVSSNARKPTAVWLLGIRPFPVFPRIFECYPRSATTMLPQTELTSINDRHSASIFISYPTMKRGMLKSLLKYGFSYFGLVSVRCIYACNSEFVIKAVIRSTYETLFFPKVVALSVIFALFRLNTLYNSNSVIGHFYS
jgi:hypothetical protein